MIALIYGEGPLTSTWRRSHGQKSGTRSVFSPFPSKLVRLVSCGHQTRPSGETSVVMVTVVSGDAPAMFRNHRDSLAQAASYGSVNSSERTSMLRSSTAVCDRLSNSVHQSTEVRMESKKMKFRTGLCVRTSSDKFSMFDRPR